MTERALLVRMALATDADQFAVGVDTSDVRVFDTVSGRLRGTVRLRAPLSWSQVGLPLHSMQLPSVSAVALGSSSSTAQRETGAHTVAATYAAAGSNTGRLAVRNLAESSAPSIVQASLAQSPITAICICAGYAVCALKDDTATVVDIATNTIAGSGLVLGRKVTALCAVPWGDHSMRLLACGVSHTLWELSLRSPHERAALHQVSKFSADVPRSVDFGWLSPQSDAAMSSAFADGEVHVWAAQSQAADDEDGATRDVEWRRMRALVTGHRIVGVTASLTPSGGCIVVATTLIGSALVWRTETLLPQEPNIIPLPPSLVVISAAPRERGQILLSGATPVGSLLLVRGTVAAPLFSTVQLDELEQRYRSSASETPIEIPCGHTAIAEAPHHSGPAAQLLLAPTFAAPNATFPGPPVHHVGSVKELPTPLEAQQSSVGLTAPLLQALHAQDDAMVIDLLCNSSSDRSYCDMARVVRSLELPFVLHLLKVVSDRLLTVGARHRLHLWIHVIMREWSDKMSNSEEARDACRPFIAPVLHNYRRWVEMNDKLATLYGRMSIYKGVKPTSVASTTTFLNTFKEVEPRGKIVKVIPRAKERRKRRFERGVIPDEAEEGDEAEAFAPPEGREEREHSTSSEGSKEGDDDDEKDIISDEGLGDASGHADISARFVEEIEEGNDAADDGDDDEEGGVEVERPSAWEAL